VIARQRTSTLHRKRLDMGTDHEKWQVRRKSKVGNSIERVAGNGLLHRRALLSRGLAFAGAAAAPGCVPGNATADPLTEAPWSLETGDAVPPYQTPSKFAKNVVRSLSNPDFEPRTSQSRTPHQLLDGMITPNGVFFTIIHDGIPNIDPSKHDLLIHGLVKRPLIFSYEALLRYPMTSRVAFIECGGNNAEFFPRSRFKPMSKRCMGWCHVPNGRVSSYRHCWTTPASTREPVGSLAKAVMQRT
jgi:Oxidoreductase molybdopterin binding domain